MEYIEKRPQMYSKNSESVTYTWKYNGKCTFILELSLSCPSSQCNRRSFPNFAWNVSEFSLINSMKFVQILRNIQNDPWWKKSVEIVCSVSKIVDKGFNKSFITYFGVMSGG